MPPPSPGAQQSLLADKVEGQWISYRGNHQNEQADIQVLPLNLNSASLWQMRGNVQFADI